MNKRYLAVLVISCVLLLVLVIVGVRFPNPVKEDIDGSDKVLPYSPIMRKPPGVDVNDNGVEDGFESEILDRVDNGTSGLYVSVLVNLRAAATPEDFDLFGSLGGLVTAGPWSGALYGFGGNISFASVLNYASEASNVLLIEKNQVVRGFLAYAARQSRARTVVWDTYGFRGDENTSIAVIDTGIDDSHVDFSSGYGQGDFAKKIVGWNNLVDASKNVTPYDDNGHGSHVSGIAAGGGFSYQDAGGRYVASWSANQLELLGVSSGSYVWTGFNVTKPGTISVNLLWSSSYGATNDNVEIVSGGPSPYVYASTNTPKANTLYTLSFVVTGGNEGYYYVRTKITSGTVILIPGGPTPIGPNLCFDVHWPYDPPEDGFPAWTGIANEARLVGVKVLDNAGWGDLDDVIAGVDWAVNNRVYYHITVMSISLGGGASTTLDNAVDNAVRSGIFVTVAMGNSGAGAELGSPAEASNVLSVAAVDLTDNTTRYSSSGGPNSDGVVKPDVTAAGGSFGRYYMLPIFSVDSNDKEAGGAFAERVSNDGAPMQGTSMSTPMVAGVGALVIDALGGWDSWVYSQDQAFMVKTIILMTATETYPKLREGDTSGVNSPTLDRGGKDIHEGYGRINADAAVEAASMAYTIGTVAKDYLGPTVLDKQCWARSVYLSADYVYEFDLTVPSGADFDLYLYNLTGNGFGEPVVVASSTGAVAGGFESITYAPSLSGRYYLVVKRASEDAGSGQFTLTSTSAPVSQRYLLYAERTARIVQGKAWDWQFGGYYKELNREWTAVNNYDKGILGNTFYIHGLVYLYDRTKNSTYLAWARNATDYILSRAWDSTNGGVYDLYDRSWNRKTSVKTLQEQADLLYVLVDLYQRTGNFTYYDYANRTVDFILAHYHDDVYGGIYRSYDQASGFPNYNKHTEVGLGAFGWGMMHWYELTRNETALDLTREANDFIWSHLYDPVYGGLLTEVDRSGGSVVNDRKYPNVEFWGVLGMLGYYRHTGNLTVKGWIEEVLDYTYDKMWDKTYGGWYRSLWRNNTVRLETKDGWTQSEQPWFWWLAYKAFSNETYRDIALLSLEWTADNNYDTRYDGFYLELHRNGTIKLDTKNDWVEGGGISAFAFVAPRYDVYLLLTVEPSQTTYSAGDTITFGVHVFNQNNPALDSTLTLAVNGPSEYYYFDFQRISVAADAIAEYTFSWEIPENAVTGTYWAEVNLVPSQLTAYDAVCLEVV